MVVMTASSGEETAWPFIEKKHGLFTYYLLKKLQETKGNCTMSELNSFVSKKVTEQSLYVNNGKLQTPSIQKGSDREEDWENLKLK